MDLLLDDAFWTYVLAFALIAVSVLIIALYEERERRIRHHDFGGRDEVH